MDDPNDPRYIRAKAKVERLANFYRTLAGFVVTGITLFIINLFTGPPWWFFWPLIFWAIALAWMAFNTFGPSARFDEDWKARKIRDEMTKDHS